MKSIHLFPVPLGETSDAFSSASQSEGFLVRECIHGLDEGLCDSCYPKPVPDAAAAPAKAPRRSSRAPKRSTAAAKPPMEIGDQRIYHVTHIKNFEAILSSGCLLADAHGATPVVDISSPGNREERRAAAVETNTVAQFVPFFVTPDSLLWEGIRTGSPDPRLSPEARQHAPADYVVLVSTVADAGRENMVIASGDAADADTTFAIAPEAGERELRRLFGETDVDDADNTELRSTEFLVWERFPFESVSLIGVANNKARDEVKQILSGAAHAPKVAVYPPWFARA